MVRPSAPDDRWTRPSLAKPGRGAAPAARLLPALLLAVLLLGLPGSGHADGPPPLVLAGDAASFSLRGHLALLDDPGAALGIAEVAGSTAFRPRPAEAPERNYTGGAIWYRITAVRDPGLPADWVLAIGEPFIDDIRVFVPAGTSGFHEEQLGRRIPSGELPLAARHHVVRITLPEAVPATIYLRLASRDEIQFEAALWRPDALMFAEVRQSTFFGMFFATLIFIVVIYTLFGIWLRDIQMLAYAIYVSTFVLFSISHTGVVAILFPASGGLTNYLLIGVGVLGNVGAMIFLWDRALNLRRTYPALHRLYMAGCAAAGVSLLIVPTPWYFVAVRPTFIATMAVTLVSLVLAAAVIRRGKANYLIKYYFIAFIPFLVFSLAHAAEVFFPSAVDILLVRRMGIAAILIHIAILSLALAHRIGLVQRDRVRADAELAAARSAMREHRNFVAMLSHQLVNPMAIISAAADLTDLRQPGNDEIAKIRRAVLRMRDLTGDVLADSRLAEPAATLNLRPVALVPLLKSLCDDRREGSAHRFRLELGDGAAAAMVMGDRPLLEILFANLLDNAIKYSVPAGEIKVAVARGYGEAVVTVADEGPGIPPDEADQVFEKFFRCSAASSQPGTGLGLYLVQRIAERHGGAVSLVTAPGQGAEFTVWLPAAQADATGKT